MSMKNVKLLLPFLLFGALPLLVTAEKMSIEPELKAKASELVKTFAGMLKPKLKATIQADGLEHAISVCSEEAPKIARQLSEESGWNIRRVSLKPRNTNSAVPDDYEKKILEQFNEYQISVESPSVIENSEIIDKQYRYMRAQIVEGICLNCHGSSMSPNIKKAIKKYYPEDAATGYSLGQVRGAFSLIKDL